MAKYEPTQPPGDPTQAAEWARTEFEAISKVLQEFDITRFVVTHVAPTKTQEGSLVFADGTDWNPGGGRGMYEYRGGTWQKL
jgi:hypothetical protein